MTVFATMFSKTLIGGARTPVQGMVEKVVGGVGADRRNTLVGATRLRREYWCVGCMPSSIDS